MSRRVEADGDMQTPGTPSPCRSELTPTDRDHAPGVEEDTLTTNDPAQESGETEQTKDPAWYREQMEASKKVNVELQAKLERLTFTAVGLDPETGMGKAVKMTFDGDLDPENLEPLIEHAKTEFNVELTSSGTKAEPTSAKPETSAAESRIGALESASSPVEPNALQEEADGKLSQGDTEGAIAAMLTKQIADGNLNIGGPKQN